MSTKELFDAAVAAAAALEDAEADKKQAEETLKEKSGKVSSLEKESDRLCEELRRSLKWPDVIEHNGVCYVATTDGMSRYKRIRPQTKGVVGEQ